MLGMLPQTLNINGRAYKIRSDYRDILQIIAAFGDKELSDEEKAYVCLKRLFIAMESIPKSDYQDAYEAAVTFIECHISDRKPSPKVVNWEKDEQLIFPAINKVAGMEVRAVPYMHWWTFLGYFQSIDREDIWGFILTIRQKRAKGKKLEKYEKDFLNANRDICEVEFREEKVTTEDSLAKMFNELLKNGGGDNGE
ncbi:hypothetical protein GT568_08570 [Coprococcus sp. BIOML-A1]|jgi:hypothetical protein|uniref:Bacteriophage Gp15 protein n=1 Tax=Agathobacter rectalis TaxID=39491 RepID=A0A6L5T8K4_9FIRM|nr:MULTISPECIES: Gp15 family bacteriophage protein [Lachnospiraceae]MSC60118.1 hypothetical protein [Agathobacter rectalis]MZK38902.1 hypothetical protein [Coprococcus sp. BIOML-A1]DAO47225.1 MAG TPA: hypothetical protein [Caudoviricetes sp.]